ncbi:hypothetical protein FALBO_5244 [Fusarium albosuccineum]|uniref:Uncharacterized protein n=1 Tax=Fusarium albosuccineum TaxID=1237068 RepID=A0A8H4LI24_9HYPO|nr:hypothetical protein FALBO_5244 [Fusarium albosuccineum]
MSLSPLSQAFGADYCHNFIQTGNVGEITPEALPQSEAELDEQMGKENLKSELERQQELCREKDSLLGIKDSLLDEKDSLLKERDITIKTQSFFIVTSGFRIDQLTAEVGELNMTINNLKSQLRGVRYDDDDLQPQRRSGKKRKLR